MDTRPLFRDLHRTPFIIPNPWDLGSARILAALGFQALATTSAGFANSLGRKDGRVTRDEAIAHAASIVGATSLPVSADLENGFGDSPEDAAETLRRALEVGLAGCSIEDFSGTQLYAREHAAERIRAAVEANQANLSPLVLTARAENHIRGNPDLADTITRLQIYQEMGADVLYAPGLTTTEQIRTLARSVDRPINVLIMPGGPSVPEIFEAGGTRVSVGSALAAAAQAALVSAGRELLDHGSHDFWTRAAASMGIVRSAMASDD